MSLQKTWWKPGCGPALHCPPAGCAATYPAPRKKDTESHGDRCLLYAQSGGVTRGDQRHRPSAVIQAARAGKVRCWRRATASSARCVELVDTPACPRGVRRWRTTPGGAFGSCRVKLKSLDADRAKLRTPAGGVPRPRRALVLYNGGNDSPIPRSKVRNSRPSTTIPLHLQSACRRRSTTTSR